MAVTPRELDSSAADDVRAMAALAMVSSGETVVAGAVAELADVLEGVGTAGMISCALTPTEPPVIDSLRKHAGSKQARVVLMLSARLDFRASVKSATSPSTVKVISMTAAVTSTIVSPTASGVNGGKGGSNGSGDGGGGEGGSEGAVRRG